MAKDLPYFKFFCSEWNDGDITLETYEHQGLFINICSYYWSNECNVHFDKLLKRFRRCEELIDDLSAAGLFKIKEDRFISISFLDEQREERLEQSKDKSKAGKASAEARRLKKLQQESNTNPTEIQQVLKSCSTESQLLRREEKREDNINEKYSESEFIERWKDARQYYLKKPYFKSKLEPLDKVKLNNISDLYNKKQIDNAIKGMFTQKGILDHLLLQPTHFLELKNFEMYLTCSVSGEQVYEKKGFKKPIDRI